MVLQVHIKHAGRAYDVELNPDLPPLEFKNAVFQLTGVPPDRMKVMIKGGILKDDADWKKIAPKAGQTFMVIGAAGELPKPPAQPIVFLEDLDDSDLAEALAKPVGLYNLGNTCYMNATIQAMRAIPELQVALSSSSRVSELPKELRNLFVGMSRTTEPVAPKTFLQVLRVVHPQFAQTNRSARGFNTSLYVQQDAEECYSQLVNSLRDVEGLPGSATSSSKKFIEQYMMGQMRRELKCDEAPDEPMTVSDENVLKVECNIAINTNYMLTGIMNSLNQKVEKHSPSLGRQATYNQHSRLTRLPAYLTVHMVRFAWRSDIGKKTKIMRKVKFPLELDALDLVTEELRAKMLPASRKLQGFEKERAERRKVRKRMKSTGGTSPAPVTDAPKAGTDVEMGDSSGSAAPERNSDAAGVVAAGTATIAATTNADAIVADAPTATAATGEGSLGKGKGKSVAAGELDEESVYREREAAELEALVDPSIKADIGCSVSGLYDLVAIVTHKGAAADAGHYIGFVKKAVFHSGAEDEEDWYKFDDDKVSSFPLEKLPTLEGGGEDASAYVLLYKTKSVA